MNPGNPAPYQIRAKDKAICLKNQDDNNIDEQNYFTCNNDKKQESWFYTTDGKLRSANQGGKYLYAYSRTDGGHMHLNDTGDVWEYDGNNQMLKLSGTNLCVDLWDNEDKWNYGKARWDKYDDVRLATCTPKKQAQTLLVTQQSDLANYDKAQCKRSDQFSFDKSGNFVTNVDPVSDEQKYECCTKQANEATSRECGYDYCVNSTNCKDFLNNVYCKKNPTAALCQTIASNINKANFCKEDPTRLLTDPSCKQVCDNINDGNTNAICEQAALELCRKNPGKYPQCACFNAVYDSNGNVNKNSEEYKNFVAGLPASKIPALGSPECWLDSCLSKTKSFSDLFKQNSKKCPQCVITAAISNTIIGGKNNIKQSCIFNNTTVSKNNQTGDDASEEDASEDENNKPWYKKNTTYIIIFVISVCILMCFMCGGGLIAIFAAMSGGGENNVKSV